MIRFVLPTLATALAMAVPAFAQPAADGVLTNEVALELAQLNTTLEKIQQLLEQQLETQTLDLLLKRAQLVSSEVAQLDNQLREAEKRRVTLEEQRADMESSIRRFRESSFDSELPQEDRDALILRFEEQLERAVTRLRQTEAETIDLESRLDSKRRELADWQQLLDRRLGGV